MYIHIYNLAILFTYVMRNSHNVTQDAPNRQENVTSFSTITENNTNLHIQNILNGRSIIVHIITISIIQLSGNG